MKIIKIIALVCLVASTATAQKLDRSIRPKPGPTPEIKLEEPTTFTLPNGLRVFVVENHKIPKVTMLVRFDFEQPLEGEFTGMNSLIGDVLMSGTTTKSKDEINNAVDGMGATLSISSSSVYASSLTRHFGNLMSISSDILINNKPSQKELDLQKEQMISGLQTLADDPDAQLENASAVKNFGKKHPYGEIPTPESVANITLEACSRYKDYFMRPNNAYMAIVGDITPKEAKKLVMKNFTNWEKRDIPKSQYTPVSKEPGNQVVFVSKTAAVQSNFSVTYPLDLKHNSPDALKVKIMNYILGGGSNSKLFKNLREGHGWTYGAYSSIKPNELKSSFKAGAKCRNEVTDSAIAETLTEMNNMIAGNFSEKDLKSAKSNLSGSFGRSLENPRTIANFAIDKEMYNLSDDYYKNYLKNIQSYTKEDILATSKKYLKTNDAYIVVSGNKNETMSSLENLDADGKIEQLDYLGREVKESNVEVAADMTAEKVVANYIEATGGAKNWAAIKDIKQTSEGNIQGMPLVMNVWRKPRKMKVELSMMGNVAYKLMVNESNGYMEVQGQKQALEGDELKSAVNSADFQLETKYAEMGYKLELNGVEKVNEKDAYVVKITSPYGDQSTEYFDTKTFYKLRTIELQEAAGQQVQNVTDYDGYKEVNGGIKLPFKTKLSLGPQKVDMETKDVKINSGIDDSEFE